MLLEFVVYTGSAQINPADFGVLFDGTGASTNAGYLQSAIDHAQSLEQDVQLPPGQIKMNAGVAVPPGMTITGSGIMATKIEFVAPFAGTAFSGENFSMKDIEITSALSPSPACAIRCNGGVFEARFLQIKHKWGIGLEANDCNGIQIRNCRLIGQDGDEAGIKIGGVSSNILISESFVSGPQNGILIEGQANNVTIKTISCTRTLYGIRFNPSNYSSDIEINMADLSGNEISSLVLHNVKNVNIQNTYGVVRKWTDANAAMGTFHVSGTETDGIMFQSNQINNHSALESIQYKPGIHIEDGQNITVHSLVNNGNASPGVLVKSAAGNIILNAISNQEEEGILYSIEDPANTTVIKYKQIK